MKALGITGANWEEATLDTFLKDVPSEFVKGTKMHTVPAIREAERADLVEFLKSKE